MCKLLHLQRKVLHILCKLLHFYCVSLCANFVVLNHTRCFVANLPLLQFTRVCVKFNPKNSGRVKVLTNIMSAHVRIFISVPLCFSYYKSRRFVRYFWWYYAQIQLKGKGLRKTKSPISELLKHAKCPSFFVIVWQWQATLHTSEGLALRCHMVIRLQMYAIYDRLSHSNVPTFHSCSYFSSGVCRSDGLSSLRETSEGLTLRCQMLRHQD